MRMIGFYFALMVGVLSAAPWWQPLGPIEKGEYDGGHADEKLDARAKAAAEAKSFAEWTSYEDEFVKFKYPKNVAIKLEVIKQGKPVKVEGGVCSTVDNSFQRAYTLKVGAASYGVFLLGAADWLDDGICFCGPMIHHAYTMREGCLVRYSLLPGHAVKKVQLLGGGLRLMAFEWTHLACTRQVYQEMVGSLVLKVPSLRTEEDLRNETIRRYGLRGKAGWLHPGRPEVEVRAVLGGSPVVDSGKLVWTEEREEYRWQMSAVFDRQKRLVKISPVEPLELPIIGTLSWVDYFLSKQGKESDPFAEGPESAPVRKGEPTVDQLATTLLELSRECEGARRRSWADLVRDLQVKKHHRDPALLEETLRTSVGRDCELEVLQAYEYPHTRQWVVAKLALLPARTPGDPEARDAESKWQLGGDASELLDFAYQEAPEEASKAVDALLASGKSHWSGPLLALHGHLSPEQARRAVVQAAGFAVGSRDEELGSLVFETIESTDFDDPAAVRKAVEAFPAGEAGSDWEKQRKAALEKLGGPP